MPLAFPVPSTLALCTSSAPPFATLPTFVSRTGESLFRPPAAFFHAETFLLPSASWCSPFGATTWALTAPGTWRQYLHNAVTGKHSRINDCERSARLRLRILTADSGTAAAARRIWSLDGSRPDDSRLYVTGKHSNAFTSWSHPASATGQSPLTKTTEVFLEEGPSAHGRTSAFEGPSAQNPFTAFSFAHLINPQIFATTQFEVPPLLDHLTAPACVARAAGGLDFVDLGCSAPVSVDQGRGDPDSVDRGQRAPESLVAKRHGLSNSDASMSAPQKSPSRDAAVAGIFDGKAARLSACFVRQISTPQG